MFTVPVERQNSKLINSVECVSHAFQPFFFFFCPLSHLFWASFCLWCQLPGGLNFLRFQHSSNDSTTTRSDLCSESFQWALQDIYMDFNFFFLVKILIKHNCFLHTSRIMLVYYCSSLILNDNRLCSLIPPTKRRIEVIDWTLKNPHSCLLVSYLYCTFNTNVGSILYPFRPRKIFDTGTNILILKTLALIY